MSGEQCRCACHKGYQHPCDLPGGCHQKHQASGPRRPPKCKYDRALGYRAIRGHRDDCPDPTSHRGCVPCTAPHCVVCGREHATNDHPVTCPGCVGKVREDLTDILDAQALLAHQAMHAATDGHLAAAAPIPGGVAQVLIGPTVRLDMLRVTRTMRADHRRSDPIPPLAVLTQWEDIWRTWFDTPRTGRPGLSRAVAFFDEHLTAMASHPADEGGPNWPAFTRQVRALRAQLEQALHDERDPERGVECFACGDELVRRFQPPARCKHPTAARAELADWIRAHDAAQDWLRTLASYPEAGGPRQPELALTHPPAELVAAARRPCGRCVDQGGIGDPSPGKGWECPGCRKRYTPGEYARAVRRDLLDRGADGDGWTHVTMAADAASTLTDHLVPASTVRKWMDRGKVASLCQWTPGRARGTRLVFWPDVAVQAVESVARALAAEAARQRRADREAAEAETQPEPTVAGHAGLEGQVDTGGATGVSSPQEPVCPDPVDEPLADGFSHVRRAG